MDDLVGCRFHGGVELAFPNDPRRPAMDGLLRSKGAVFATTAAIAFAAAAAPVAAKEDHGHHKDWTAKQCGNQSTRWKKAHRHPSAKQTTHENNLLAKHGCEETV
jgi:hypothetical protein